ncbi:MAG: hypothetical protein WBA00_16480, partial [Rhodococcus sp. (in: high G+C Gram-positive bacteria)]
MMIRRNMVSLRRYAIGAAFVPLALTIGAGVASAQPAPTSSAVEPYSTFDATGCIVHNDRGGCAGSGVYSQIAEGGAKGAASGAAGGCVSGAIAGAGAGCGPGAVA